ncbi:MAG: glutamate racemase [Desulfobacterales bacterium]|nr:glutamate racemase [Desulfobacterales bacterium]
MIGIFDSGIGGLTVLKAITEKFPGYDIIYFGDTARTPYGNKSPETVIEYAVQGTAFLLNNGAKIIVMACSTSSGVAFDVVEKKFEAPVFEVVTPAVALALEFSRKTAIGVIGTRATIESGIYEKKIKALNSDARVYSVASPLLVPLVEEGWIDRPETAMIVKKYLHPLKVRQIDTLILGCTHYPLLRHVIRRKIGKRINIIDSSTGVSGKVEKFLKERPDIDCLLSKNGKTRIFVSDVTDQFAKTARVILKQNVLLEQVKI